MPSTWFAWGGPQLALGHGHFVQIRPSPPGQNRFEQMQMQTCLRPHCTARASGVGGAVDSSTGRPHCVHQWLDLVRSYEHIHRPLGDGHATVGAGCDCCGGVPEAAPP
jgi:hypothetical protein